MILFRARKFGSADPWTVISVNCGDDDEGVEAEVSQIIGSSLGTSDLHVQMMDDEGVWGDLE